MSKISLYNHEGYRDPTAYAALNNAEKAFKQKAEGSTQQRVPEKPLPSSGIHLFSLCWRHPAQRRRRPPVLQVRRIQGQHSRSRRICCSHNF